MGIGISIVFIAAGAIMAFAVDVEKAEGFNINTIGIILMVVGGIGVLLAMTIFGGDRRGRGDVVVSERREVI